MSTPADHRPASLSAETLFSRMLVGVDGSPEASEAVRQAAVRQRAGRPNEALAA